MPLMWLPGWQHTVLLYRLTYKAKGCRQLPNLSTQTLWKHPGRGYLLALSFGTVSKLFRELAAI